MVFFSGLASVWGRTPQESPAPQGLLTFNFLNKFRWKPCGIQTLPMLIEQAAEKRCFLQVVEKEALVGEDGLRAKSRQMSFDPLYTNALSEIVWAHSKIVSSVSLSSLKCDGCHV